MKGEIKYEYKVLYELKISFEETLNELGLEGWELVSVNQSSSVTGIATLKRIKIDEFSKNDRKNS